MIKKFVCAFLFWLSFAVASISAWAIKTPGVYLEKLNIVSL